MTINTDLFSVQPPAAPVVAPQATRQAPVTAVADREAAGNNQRPPDKGDRGLKFRAILSAQTFNGLAQALDTGTKRDSVVQSPPPRPSKVPTGAPTVLSASEAAGLYGVSQAVELNTAAAAEFRAASTSYATNFFAVERTFARPGEALELSV